MTATLSHHCEAITRLVHAAGRASVTDMLATYQARPMTPKNMRNTLEHLAELGWLVRVRNPAVRYSNGVAWAISEAAVPHFLKSQRLPRRPDSAPPVAHVQPAPVKVVRPPAEPAPAPYRPQFTPWVPPPPTALRPGALDFLNHPSHGACR